MIVTVLDFLKSYYPRQRLILWSLQCSILKSYLPTAEVDTVIVTVLDFEKLFTHGRGWYCDRYRARLWKVIYPRQRLILWSLPSSILKSNLPTAEIDTLIVTLLDLEKLFTHGRDWYSDRYRARFWKVICARRRLILWLLPCSVLKSYLLTAEIDTKIVTVLSWNEWLQMNYPFKLRWQRKENG